MGNIYDLHAVAIEVAILRGGDVKILSIKYQLSIDKLKMLTTSKINNASAKILYQQIHLRRPIHHTKLYVHTCYEQAWREDKSLTSVFQLSMWVLYYRDPITFCTSIIESFEGDHSLPIICVTEKSQTKFFRNL